MTLRVQIQMRVKAQMIRMTNRIYEKPYDINYQTKNGH